MYFENLFLLYIQRCSNHNDFLMTFHWKMRHLLPKVLSTVSGLLFKPLFVFYVQVITVLTKDRKIELIPGSGRPSPSSRSYHTRHTSDDRESPDRSHTPYHEHSETPKPAQGAPKNVKVKIDEQTVDVKPEQTTIR